MSAGLRGVHLEERASRQLRSLDPLQRRRVAHVLGEMVAVVELTSPTVRHDGLGTGHLHFTAAGTRVEYSIDASTGLLTVHTIEEPLTAAG